MKYKHQRTSKKVEESLPAWGEWIEIITILPDAERFESLPAWGEWIEMYLQGILGKKAKRLSPHGESGLKLFMIEYATKNIQSLSPHGESGLKSQLFSCIYFPIRVSPRMGRVD